jgi:hypothetical protein
VQALEGAALFTMPDPASGFFHDFSKTDFVLQRWELPTQARKQLD